MGLVDVNGNPLKTVKKAYLAESADFGGLSAPPRDLNGRGINVYNISELQGYTGRDKKGEMISGYTERPMFTLSLQERMEMFNRTTTLQGIITGRAKRISGLNWKVSRKTMDNDRVLSTLNEYKEIYDEASSADLTDMKMLVIKYKMKQNIMAKLPDVFDDLSNFDSALRRFKKRQSRKDEDQSTVIEEWIRQPNINDTFAQLLHKWVVDLMVHGSTAIYKDFAGNTLKNFYILPGGTVFPFREMHVGGISAYFQIIPSMEAQVFFDDEISFSSYISTSWSSYGICPLEALINKVAETLLFDKRSANQADGTRPPEKLVVFGKSPSPFGNLTSSGDFELPMDPLEQKRIETRINTARKEAIATLTGVGTPTIMDISKSDTFSSQQARQDKLLRDMALIYNMSNMEVNLAGGEFTSGKETSESQKEIDQEKGVSPMLKSIESILNREIIPFRFGYDYEFKFDVEPSETEQVELEQKKMQTGTYTVNELREKRGDDVFSDPKYDEPQPPTQDQQGQQVDPSQGGILE